jgi:hypothetical protein
MNPPRKSTGQDKAPAETTHKPSRKVAIDEVLRSLQDLVNNELAVESPKAEVAPPAAAPADRVPESAPSANEGPVVALPGDAFASESIMLEGLPEAPPVGEQAAERAIPPEGLQQELPHLDVTADVAVDTGSDENSSLLVEFEAPAPELPDTEEIGGRDEDEIATAAPAEYESDTGESIPLDISTAEVPASDDSAVENLSSAEAGDWSDIPVLDDAVEFHEELAPLPSSAPVSLPDARRLAVQVAARLNVELRKEGKPVLSSEIIARLVRVLEDALAKGAPNVENTRTDNHPDKH